MRHEKITEEYKISNDKSLLDLNVIHSFLASSYWAKNIPLEIVTKSIENSLCYGMYLNDKQIGFAKVVTDYATFAFLADVFITEEYRGKGYSKKLVEFILGNPELQKIRGWMLKTKDAHGLYKKYGFVVSKTPEKIMEKRVLEKY